MILRSRRYQHWMARLALAAILLVSVMPTVSRWLESRAPDAAATQVALQQRGQGHQLPAQQQRADARRHRHRQHGQDEHREHRLDASGVQAVAEASATTAEQVAKLKAANAIIVQQAASDWLYLYPQIVIAKSNLTGYPVNGLNSQFYVYDIAKK